MQKTNRKKATARKADAPKKTTDNWNLFKEAVERTKGCWISMNEPEFVVMGDPPKLMNFEFLDSKLELADGEQGSWTFTKRAINKGKIEDGDLGCKDEDGQEWELCIFQRQAIAG